MSLFQRMNAIVPLIILFFASNVVYAQESNLKNPESVETIDFIQASLDKGQIRLEADLNSSESNISERVNFIQASFDKGQPRAKLWSYGWTAIYGVATCAQTIQAISSRHDRASNIVSASESLLGVAALVIDPFHARSSGSDLKEIPESTPEEQNAKLDKAENWLERNYKQEKLGRSWLSHVGVLVVGVIGAGIVWHYEGRKNALINGLGAIAGGELLIWTQPTRGIKDYKEYRNKYKDAYDGIPEKKYFIAPSPNGFVAGVYF
ncbi:MAG: hypothetical protein ACXU97_10590 [Thermodesulfobacteriota bacterium]